MDKETLKAKKAAYQDMKKYGELPRYKNFIGKSGYKREGYSPFKKEMKNGKEITIYDPIDAPYGYNYLIGMCI